MDKKKLYALIKTQAASLGFSACGISKAEFLENEAIPFENWLKEGKHGSMTYMERHFDKRLDPRLLHNGAKSVISLTYNYFSGAKQSHESFYKLSAYTFIEDYHYILKQKMQTLLAALKNNIGHFEASLFVDSAPVLERAWAVRSGLGVIGHNKSLIIPHKGSFFFLCQIICDLEPQYDTPLNIDICKNCNICIKACPTKAIEKDKTINASKCISYLTIEHKKPIAAAMMKNAEKSIFGCDICQQACPHNTTAEVNKDLQPYLLREILGMTKTDWENLDNSSFKKLFRKTAMYRTGLKKLKSNIAIQNQ